MSAKKPKPPKLCQIVVVHEPGQPLLLIGLWSDGTLKKRREGGQWVPVP